MSIANNLLQHLYDFLVQIPNQRYTPEGAKVKQVLDDIVLEN